MSPQLVSRCEKPGETVKSAAKEQPARWLRFPRESRPADRSQAAVQVLRSHARRLLRHGCAGNRLLRPLFAVFRRPAHVHRGADDGAGRARRAAPHADPGGLQGDRGRLRRRRPRAGGAAVSAYSSALEAIRSILSHESEADQVLRQTVEVLHDRFDHYSWVGIYLVEGDELVLGPWRGPQAPQHVRIPVGQGICGAAAASGRTEIVDDVKADERYLACFPSTRSEIVLPISYEGRVVGELDLDSH